MTERRQEPFGCFEVNGDVNGRGDHVVRRLAHVHMIVRMNIGSEPAACQRCDHLVRVHVGAGARTGLKNVDGKLIVPLAVGDFPGGGLHGAGESRLDQAEFAVGPSARRLHQPECTQERPRKHQTTDRKVLDRPLGLCTVEGSGRNTDLTEGISFDSKFVHHSAPPTETAQGCYRRRDDSACHNGKPVDNHP